MCRDYIPAAQNGSRNSPDYNCVSRLWRHRVAGKSVARKGVPVQVRFRGLCGIRIVASYVCLPSMKDGFNSRIPQLSVGTRIGIAHCLRNSGLWVRVPPYRLPNIHGVYYSGINIRLTITLGKCRVIKQRKQGVIVFMAS